MTKTLDELLKQKKWTGRDVGLLHLYSVQNDITSAVAGVKPKKLYTQTFFDKVSSRLNERENEQYNVYAALSQMLYQMTRLRQVYLKEADLCLCRLQMTFEEIIRSETAMDAVKKDEKETLKEILFTSDTLFADKSKVEELKTSYAWMCKSLCFIFTSNFVEKIIFRCLDVEFMDNVLFDTKEYTEHLEALNSTFNKLYALLSEARKVKMNKIYSVTDWTTLLPNEDDACYFAHKVDPSLEESDYFGTVGSISSCILEIVGAVMKRREQ